jgi:hypothetical protein
MKHTLLQTLKIRACASIFRHPKPLGLSFN